MTRPPAKHCDETQPLEPVYIHTAIAYTNGPPHVGHAYEFITADAIARYNRMFGRDTYFCSGTDEHGQKVQTSAIAAGRTPQQHCDFWANKFKEIMELLNVKPDFFVRTTMPEHYETVQKIWRLCVAKGDIYKDCYAGWYDVRNENFVKESDAALTDYKDPETGVPYEKKSEETYFFKLSKYQDAILEWLSNPESVRPETYRQETISFVKNGLDDICVSRTTFDWGVPVPDDPAHVMYVWVDALNNYMTNLGYKDNDVKYQKHWLSGQGSRNACIIGKDIVRFHAVIWPGILMSADIPLTDYHLVTHGFVSAADGAKMSKSIGNVIDPIEVVKEFGVDALRHYMCSSTAYGSDMKFSTDTLKDLNNGVLADVIGNLFNRAANLTLKTCDGKIPSDCIQGMVDAKDVPFDVLKLVKESDDAMQEFKLDLYCETITAAARAANKWLADKAPWKMECEEEKRKVIRIVNEACFVLYHFFAVTCPETMDRYAQGTYPSSLLAKSKIQSLNNYQNIPVGTEIKIPGVIFSKFVEKVVKQTFEEAKAAKKAKQEARAKQQAEAKAAKAGEAK